MFKYLVIDLESCYILGTNSEGEAAEFSHIESYFVIDTEAQSLLIENELVPILDRWN